MSEIKYKSLYINDLKISSRLGMADNYFLRLRGLIGRTLDDTLRCLAIIPCNQIHTCMMGYPIDVIYADKSGKILKCQESVMPGKFLAPVKHSYYVIELAAGSLREIRATQDEISLIGNTIRIK